MTIAELHGKLSPHRLNGCHDRMEDLLTSDVFGTMKYAGWQFGFMEWLRSAIHPFDGTMASMALPKDDDIERLHYVFWPSLANGREPDMLIGIECSDGKIIQIMVEAKYLSGASDVTLQDTEINSYYSGNQIADQVNNFPKTFPDLSKKSIAACVHMYVTAHYSCPIDIYENAKTYIKKIDIPLFWINWQSLPAFLIVAREKSVTGGTCALLSDLLDLLIRKDLVPFAGFHYQTRGNFSQLVGRSFWSPLKSSWWSMSAVSLPKPQHFWG
jgi:hypothetical protein